MEVAHRYQVDDALRLVQKRLSCFVTPLTLLDLAEAATIFSLNPLLEFCTCYSLIQWDSLAADVRNALPISIRSEVEELQKAGCGLDPSRVRKIELVVMSKFPHPREDDESSESSSESTEVEMPQNQRDSWDSD
jgi:hypothetical protein